MKQFHKEGPDVLFERSDGIPSSMFDVQEAVCEGEYYDSGIEIRLVCSSACDEHSKRLILKTDSCSLVVPEIDMEIPEGKGRFCSLREFIEEVYDNLKDRVKDQTLLERMRQILAGESPFTVVLNDPLGNSRIQSVPNTVIGSEQQVQGLDYYHFDDSIQYSIYKRSVAMDLEYGVLEVDEELEDFVNDYCSQLDQIPRDMWSELQRKLRDPSDADLITDFGVTDGTLRALQDISAYSKIYVVQNTLVEEFDNIYSKLETDEDLRIKCRQILSIDRDSSANTIYNEIWKGLQPFKLNSEDGIATLWYLTDEIISATPHDNTPNFVLAPFYYEDKLYSTLWPVQDISVNAIVTRDYWPQIANAKHRELMESIIHGLPKQIASSTSEKTIVTHNKISYDPIIREKESRSSVKVYTDSKLVINSLKLQSEDETPQFTTVEDKQDADILFIVHEHFKDFDKAYRDHQFVNQFESEDSYTMKGMLCSLMQDHSFPFIPETYDLTSVHQTQQFLQSYQKRLNEGSDNVWITKPYNLSRSMDMMVTDDYRAVLRQSETGPKIVSKYISRPCLLDGKKFDFRFLIMVKPVSDTEIAVFTHNTYYIRIGNLNYSLDNFHQFQKHFTVMNYKTDDEGEELEVIRYSQQEFIDAFQQEYQISWNTVRDKIFSAFNRFFTALKPQILKDDKSAFQRSVYGVDVMLDSEFNPYILEVNFSPDARRICHHEYPRFYIDAFRVLFTDQLPSTVTRLH